MAGFRFKLAAAKGQFQKAIDEDLKIIANAATGAISDAGAFIKTTGRANIASAGFSIRWQNALRVDLFPDPKKAKSIHPALNAYHKIPYAGVFERGATIAGSPLLWLPLPDVPTNAFGRHLSPANFVRLIGPLRSVFRPGKPPLLLAQLAGNERTGITINKLVRGAKAGRRSTPGAPSKVSWVPVFYGLDKVRLAKRFNLTPIFNTARDRLGEYYLKNLKVR